MLSKFQSEALFLHLVVALRIELVEECHFLVGHGERLVELGQNAQFQHLVAEVAAVELDAEDGLIEVLQLGHGELIRQQLETDGLKVNLKTQFIGGLAQHQVVVESQRRNLVERKPLSFGCIVAGLYLAETYQGEVGEVALSVEGIWQGLKVFEDNDIDTSLFSKRDMKNMKRTKRKFGHCLGHRKGVHGEELLDYLTARKEIYVPCYKWVLENRFKKLVTAIRIISKNKPVVLLDYNTNPDINNPKSPLSHASLIKAYIEGKLE